MNITHKSLRWAPLVAILTFVLYVTLPKSFNFIPYFIPVLYACVIFSRDGKGFNLYVLFFLFLASIIIPSGFFTLDVSGDNILPGVQPSLNLVYGFQFWINIVVVFIVLVIPVGIIIFIIVELVNPLSTNKNYEGAISTVMKMVIIICFFFIGCFILDLIGALPEWFFWRYIRDFVIWIVQVIVWLGGCVGNFFTGKPMPVAPAWPSFGGMSLGQIMGDSNSLFPEMNAAGTTTPGSIQWFCVNVNAAIPLILAIIPLVMWFAEKRGKDSYHFINKYMVQDKSEDLKIRLVKFNAPATIFGIAVLVYAFAMFLNYNNSGIDISLYTVITAFCLILIIIGILPVRTGSFFKCLQGTLVGVGGVFFFYNILSSGLSVLEFTDASLPIRILNQIFFVAPTESLIFHVVIPGLGLLATYYIFKHFKNKSKDETVQAKIVRLSAEQAKNRELLNQAVMSNSRAISYQGKTITEHELSIVIFNLDNEIKVLEAKAEKDSTITLNTLLFSKAQYLALIVLLSFILPNFIFSSYHVFRSTYNLLDFWVNGVGFIYLGSGCWLTFITLRFGWLPCILSHALINIISILLLGCAV